MTWPLSTSQWRYCLRVGLAGALGYVLAAGNHNQYAVYSAFTAALIVGVSIGEDLDLAARRVKGTIAGVLSGMLVTSVLGPNFLTVGLSVALAAFISTVFGWGVAAARIGISVCIITLATHHGDAVTYDVFRGLYTLVGIPAGLFVTFFVWPVRGPREVKRTGQVVLQRCREVLDAVDRGETGLRKGHGKLHDAIADVVKAARDHKRERKAGQPADVNESEVLEVLRLGADVLSVTLREPVDTGSLPALRQRLDQLASTIAK